MLKLISRTQKDIEPAVQLPELNCSNSKELRTCSEPAEIVAPFEKEMHDWFGTPEWYGRK
ncbi:MAG: hypothetical protein HUJ26_04755 [Planctomycetaceae bacterium]|nr:hypothetical protein [Planctomycetaceae bacterium]